MCIFTHCSLYTCIDIKDLSLAFGSSFNFFSLKIDTHRRNSFIIKTFFQNIFIFLKCPLNSPQILYSDPYNFIIISWLCKSQSMTIVPDWETNSNVKQREIGLYQNVELGYSCLPLMKSPTWLVQLPLFTQTQ